MKHHMNAGDLIIKQIPSVDQQAAHLTLAEQFYDQMTEMGIPPPKQVVTCWKY